MADRSKINGNNSRKHGLSQDVLYEVYRRLYRDPEVIFCDEWMEGGHLGRGMVVFVSDIRETIGYPPTPYHYLEVKRSGDPIFRRGNVEWVYREPRVTRRQSHEFNRKIKSGRMVPGTPPPVPECSCWLTEEPCPYPPCSCPWQARWECACCVGVRTRLGLMGYDPQAG